MIRHVRSGLPSVDLVDAMPGDIAVFVDDDADERWAAGFNVADAERPASAMSATSSALVQLVAAAAPGGVVDSLLQPLGVEHPE